MGRIGLFAMGALVSWIILTQFEASTQRDFLLISLISVILAAEFLALFRKFHGATLRINLNDFLSGRTKRNRSPEKGLVHAPAPAEEAPQTELPADNLIYLKDRRKDPVARAKWEAEANSKSAKL